MEGFNKIFTENDSDLVAETILKQLGITDEDFSEQKKAIEDKINLSSTLTNIGVVNDIPIDSWENMQKLMSNDWFDDFSEESKGFREVIITNLENILGMQPNFNLIAGLSPEAQENLAGMFGITSQQFDQVLDFVFPTN